MDWRNEAMIIASTSLIIIRLRMMVVFLCYYFMKRRRDNCRKRKSGYSYSMVNKIRDQIKHMDALVNLSDSDCINLLRMDRHSFHKLSFLLEHGGGLKNSRYVTVQEQTALFLQTMAHHHKNRVVKFDFKRSGQTISHYFNKTLDALFKIQELLVVKPKPVASTCTDERWRSFEGCLGALDGTHIKLRVPIAEKERYRSHKGDICTNVLGVCDTNMNFVYVLAGWEGSTGDGRVLREALVRPGGLKVPEGNYYLCDLGYTNGEGLLTPYRGRRYHLDEWAEGHARPQDKEEYFNMKHSRARNVIECAFGLLKGRWPILKNYTHYSVETNCRIIQACALLHNFIRLNMAIDPYELSNPHLQPSPPDDTEYIEVIDASQQWHTWRDDLAAHMFNNRRSR